ncbi:MAG: hypothetical protein FWB73_00680 [Treponema sp.]|nr:hypothetical protein [Treponema sp.]
MIQLYLLSILCNGLSGYLLFTGSESDGDTGSFPRFPVNNPSIFLILGIISIVTGFLKLLSPSLDGILILGDLLPAAGGIIAGLMLIFGIYRQNTAARQGELDRIGVSLLAFKKPIGLGLLIIALVHFLFPKALFL